ncbi:unnamed protein product [Haemonchus placei]|uniref:Uncharacterized protein n=1 Tax=Haemonchus placei TaxID=6290 RepID=A0A158QLB4_HAEPC|nr:unnamed protein product [Haemonchus placei]
MSESLLPDGMAEAINATVIFPSGTVETRPTQLWEVIVVISCPVLFVLFLCCCVVCMIIKNYDRQPAVEPSRRRNLGRIMRQLPPPPKYDVEPAVEPSRRRNLGRIMRQLPPPPKYDVAVASSQSPPPLYSDIEKGVIFDPLRSLSSTAPSSPTSPDAPPLTIQYLYPPRYESPAVHSSVTCTESDRSVSPVSNSIDSSDRPPAVTHRPSVTVVLMSGAL